MIFDLNKVPPGEARDGYDVCIAGAGVAGITLATDLAARGLRVLLLEAGGIELSDESQNVYKGPSVGRPYFALDQARLRFLGGTSNHWSGWCRPLDARDLAKRDYIPKSGWPIAKAELDRYLDRAAEILEIPSEFPGESIEESTSDVAPVHLHFSPPVHFGEKYIQELHGNRRIDLFLNANLVDVRLAEANDQVIEFRCANYADQAPRYAFAAKAYVLAMGGIETPRMMLNFHSQIPAGIGNERGLVGRYFMDHIDLVGGYYATQKDVWPYGNFEDDGIFVPTTRFMERQKIGNAAVRYGQIVEPDPDPLSRAKQRFVCAEDIVRDFVSNFADIWCPTHVYIGGELEITSEQVPNPDSRVFLADETDRFGLRRGALDWRITDQERHTIKQTMIAFGRHLAANKFGNVKLVDWLLDDTQPVPGVGENKGFGAGWHHMGTTRMAETPTEGVVDENCRVFGMNNLFIAGSSVFPTGGFAGPTLTIVQLALRLGEHLSQAVKAWPAARVRTGFRG